MTKYTNAIIIGLFIVLGFAFFGGKTEIMECKEFGATTEPTEFHTFKGGARIIGLTDGGATTTISADASTTALTAAQVCDSQIILWTATATDGDATLTTPSDQAFVEKANCLDNDGDSVELIYRNTGTAVIGASTTVLVAGTDVVLLMPETTGADIVIEPGQSMIFKFIKQGASTTLAVVQELIDAD